MRSSLTYAILIVLVGTAAAVGGGESTWDEAVRDPAAAQLARPSAVQYAWHEQERVMFVCLDPCTWQGREYDNHSTFLKQMNPARLDANQWCKAARAWGAKEILLVCKHCGGFCWWPTETTDYCVKNIAWKGGKGNMVQEVVDACRRHDLKIGVYIYSDDPKYMANIGRGGRTDDPAKQKEWNAKLRKQWEEVLTLCGPDLVQEIWFDGSCIVPLDDIIKKLAPRATILQSPLTDIRWVGNEAGYARDPNWNTLRATDLKSGVATEAHSTPDGDAWAPVECDTTLYDHFWFWSEHAEKHACKSLDKLLHVYMHSAGHGAVLLLNSTAGPTASIAPRPSPRAPPPASA
jgi:alpha-L-fucosidase